MARAFAVRTGLGLVVFVVLGAFFAWLAFLSWLVFEGLSWLIHLL